MNYLEIVDVQGREILDSRGNPTVEAEITLADGTVPGAAPLPVHPPASLKPWSCATATRAAIWARASPSCGEHQHRHR